MVARRDKLRQDPEIARRAILALRCGYDAAVQDPQAAIGALTSGRAASTPTRARREFIAVSRRVHPAGRQVRRPAPP